MTTRTDRIQSVLLGILLAIGAGLAWGVAVGWTLATTYDVAFRSAQANEQIVVLRDGTPLVQSYQGWDYQTKTYRTLDGKRVDANSSQVENWTLLQRPGWPKDWFAGLPWSERITPIYRGQSSTEVWYVVHDGNLQGHTHLVGYDTSTKLRIGYVGRHGFRTDTPSLEDQFPVNGRRYRYSRYLGAYRGDLRTDYLLTDEGLVRIDWDARTVKLLWKDRNPIRVAMSYVRDTNGTLIKSSILVRTLDRVRVLDMDGNEQETFVLPGELRDASHFKWTPLPSGKALAWRPSGKHDELFWLDASGVVRQEQVDLLRARQISNREATMILSLAAPVPAGFAVVTAVAPLDSPEHSDAGSYWVRLARTLAEVWPSLLTVVTIGLVLAWLCYRRQCKYGLPWTPLWVVLVLLFGLPAYFGYLAHRRWPACLPCPNCGRTVPRDRPACFACHRDFPAPAPKGIEVFA